MTGIDLIGSELAVASCRVRASNRCPTCNVSYLQGDDKVYETYWTTDRGNQLMAPLYGLLDNR